MTNNPGVIVISEKLSRYLTVYFDLVSLKRFFERVKDSEVFPAVIIYPFMRDSCLIIYQVHKDIIGTTDEVPFAIKEFRNKIKLFEKGGNEKVFKEILKQQFDEFGFETDNLGFYLNENRQTIGSTIYVGNTLRRLQNLREIKENDKPEIYYVSQEIGSEVQAFIKVLEKEIPMLQKNSAIESGFNELEAFEIIYKDINHTRLFNGNDLNNVFKYRLLIILQECFAVMWISENYDSRIIDRDFVDEYFIQRFINIRMDSIIDSLINLKKFYISQFNELDNSTHGELSIALEDYMLHSFEKVAVLRNTIHYDKVKNFYDYFIEDEMIDLTGILNLNRIIFKCIDEFLSISNIPSQY